MVPNLSWRLYRGFFRRQRLGRTQRTLENGFLDACRTEIAECANGLGCPTSELATTLAFAAVADEGVLLAGNLGDGVVAAFRDNRPEVLIAPMRGEFANETVFVTSIRASKHFRLIKKQTGDYDGFAVMSDGAAESLYQRRKGALADALTILFSSFEERGAKGVHNIVQKSAMPLLTSRTLDDCSLALLRYVCVATDSLGAKNSAFQMELLGTKMP